MSQYIVSTGHTIEMMKFLYDRIGLDLRGQHLDGLRWMTFMAEDRLTGRVVAALVCEFTTPFEAHFSIAVDQPACITRTVLRRVFQTIFTRAARITARIEATDDDAEDKVKRMGFVYEGFLRRGYDGYRDALIYGMLMEDCKYLPGARAARPMNGEDHDETTDPTRSVRDSLGAAGSQRRERGGISYN